MQGITRRGTALLAGLLVIGLVAGPADARKRKRRRAARAKRVQASEQTRVAVERLLGKYRWGMTPAQVLGLIRAEIRARYAPILKKAKDPLDYDRIRRKMMADIKRVEKGFVRFEGQKTPWDVSLVEKEFAHKNGESMLIRWGKRDRRFYFFHEDKLWKVYIAFNADLFKGKSFEDFAAVMEARFGTPQRKYVINRAGKSVLDHLFWPPSGSTLMRAIDNTAFYGNFCLVLADEQVQKRVLELRRLNAKKNNDGEALIDNVIAGSNSGRDANADIIDRITGANVERPPEDAAELPAAPAAARRPSTPARSSEAEGEGAVAPEGRKKKRGKKINPKNPLEGIDL